MTQPQAQLITLGTAERIDDPQGCGRVMVEGRWYPLATDQTVKLHEPVCLVRFPNKAILCFPSRALE